MTSRLDIEQELFGSDHVDPFLQDEDKLTLAELIPRILMERQSFLHITEESLQEEIDNADEGLWDKPEDASEEPSNDLESEYDTFQKQKFELSKHLGLALNETSLSLDLVSLLVSAAKPNVGKSTMSPHLAKNIPFGSLGADRLPKSEPNVAESQKIGYGWKHQALSNIVKSFGSASTRLREQVATEKRYWEMVLSVLGNDEVLFKLRDPSNGSRAIGVKYGYGDSGSSLYDKGLALLKKDPATGEVSFHPLLATNYLLTTKAYKFVRVKVLSKIDEYYSLTGQSKFETAMIRLSSNSPRIVNDVERARYFLFEEDLFYYLTREARNLVCYNVSLISNKIVIELNGEMIEFESVFYDEGDDDELNNVYQNINDVSSVNNTKAQGILTFTKIMLCCYYSYNLKLKQKMPTLLTKWKQSNTHPLILRPLLGHIRHEANVKNVNAVLQGILDEHLSLQHTLTLKKHANLSKLSEVTNPFQKSIEKPFSKFEVTLEHALNKSALGVDIEVTATEVFANLVINLTVIKYDSLAKLKNNQNGTNVLLVSFTDMHDAQECLSWTVLNFAASL